MHLEFNPYTIVRFQPFLKVGVWIICRTWPRLVIGLGFLSLEVHQLRYGRGWGQVCFYLDVPFGTFGFEIDYVADKPTPPPNSDGDAEHAL